jgi:hypothetical protein
MGLWTSDQRRLADPGVAADQQQLRRAGRRALEPAQHDVDLALAAVHVLRQLEPGRDVALGELERRVARAVEVLQAQLEIVAQPERALVAGLERLGHQLLDDAGDHHRDRRIEIAQPARLARDVGVDQLQRAAVLERRSAAGGCASARG